MPACAVVAPKQRLGGHRSDTPIVATHVYLRHPPHATQVTELISKCMELIADSMTESLRCRTADKDVNADEDVIADKDIIADEDVIADKDIIAD